MPTFVLLTDGLDGTRVFLLSRENNMFVTRDRLWQLDWEEAQRHKYRNIVKTREAVLAVRIAMENRMRG